MGRSLLKLFCLVWAVIHVIIDSSTSSRPKVLILGGGLAGLQVGKALQTRGERDFVILEADSRLGGRFLSACPPNIPACVNEIYVESQLGHSHPLAELLHSCAIAYSPVTFPTIVAVNDEGKDVTTDLNSAFVRVNNAATAMITEWNADEGHDVYHSPYISSIQ